MPSVYLAIYQKGTMHVRINKNQRNEIQYVWTIQVISPYKWLPSMFKVRSEYQSLLMQQTSYWAVHIECNRLHLPITNIKHITGNPK